MGGKTGLYLVGFNRKDGIVGKRDTAIPLNASDFRGINRNQTQNAVLVDLCSGHPKQTDAARCLTARYGQTTLSNRKGERSGVLLIKEATKKGYKAIRWIWATQAATPAAGALGVTLPIRWKPAVFREL